MTSTLAIIGAGCAGLSLAVHLLEAGDRRPLHVVEPRTSFPRDRTFCSWRLEPTPFDGCVSRRWTSWLVADGARRHAGGSTRHPYQQIGSDDFHAYALERLAAAPHVTVSTGTRVERLVAGGRSVCVETDRGGFAADHVFDSRPAALARSPEQPALVQAFVGRHVEADVDVFDAGTVTLMDFGLTREGAPAFLYVLPQSSRRALVEATFIGDPASVPDLERELDRRLRDDWPHARFMTRGTEAGRLPMTTAPASPSGSPRIVRIGLGGGWARPSSGYAFASTQRVCRRLARDLARGEAPRAALPFSPWTRFLDGVFLRALRELPPAELFLRACSAPGDRVARFLGGRSTWLDDLAIIARMPKLPFARLALGLPTPAVSRP